MFDCLPGLSHYEQTKVWYLSVSDKDVQVKQI